MALRLPVPAWERIQVTISLSKRVTKNMRSASERWAMLKIEARGRPWGV
jgi:hypothetical protein